MDDPLCRLQSLLDLADAVHSSVDEVLAPLGLTRATWQTLHHLQGCPGRSQGWLASQSGCAPSNVTRLVDRLSELGWVQREPSAEDRRQVLAVLTARGREVLAAANERLSELQDGLVARLEETETRCDGASVAGCSS